MRRLQDRLKRRFKLLNQFRPVTMIASTAPGTYNLRISAQTVTNRLREIGERPPYKMYVLYAAFLFWPSIWILCNFAQVSFFVQSPRMQHDNRTLLSTLCHVLIRICAWLKM